MGKAERCFMMVATSEPPGRLRIYFKVKVRFWVKKITYF